jgi:hypothetical protein
MLAGHRRGGSVVVVHVVSLAYSRVDAEQMASSPLRPFQLKVFRLKRDDGSLVWLMTGYVVANTLDALLDGTDWSEAPASAIIGEGKDWALVVGAGTLVEPVRGSLEDILNAAAGLSNTPTVAAGGLWRAGTLIAEQQLNPLFGVTRLKLNWSAYGFKPEPLKVLLAGLRELSEPVSHGVGFRRFQADLLPWVIGRDKSWSFAVWDQDAGGPPIATFADSSAGDTQSRAFIWDHLLQPIFDHAVVEGPAAVARLHSEMSGDYALLACVGGGGARGVWFCSPESVLRRLFSSPGCAFYLARRYAKLTTRVGEERPLHSQYTAFPWGSWEEFLELAGIQLARQPKLAWRPLDVPTGTTLPDLVTDALESAGLAR